MTTNNHEVVFAIVNAGFAEDVMYCTDRNQVISIIVL